MCVCVYYTIFAAICTDFLAQKQGNRFVNLALSVLVTLVQKFWNLKTTYKHYLTVHWNPCRVTSVPRPENVDLMKPSLLSL